MPGQGCYVLFIFNREHICHISSKMHIFLHGCELENMSKICDNSDKLNLLQDVFRRYKTRAVYGLKGGWILNNLLELF